LSVEDLFCFVSWIFADKSILLRVVFLILILQQVVQKEREEKLAEILKDRLNQYVQGNKEEFIKHAEAEVARLSNAGKFSFSGNDCLKENEWKTTAIQ
jgi:hypothetical protein